MSDFTAAKARLLLHEAADMVFFASLVMGRRFVRDPSIPMAGVSAAGTIYYNPEWVASLSTPQKTYVLLHEVLHIVGLDHARCGDRDPSRWNAAADLMINRMLDCMKMERPPVGMFDDSIDLEKDTREQIYERLPSRQYACGGDQGSGDFGSADDLMNRPGETPLTEAEVRQMVAAAAQTAKARGDLSAGLDALIEAALVTPRLPWFSLLYQWVDQRVAGGLTWATPNRRRIPFDVYLPSPHSSNALRCLFVGIDTSGSVADATLSEFLGHLHHVVEDMNIHTVVVCTCDTQVTNCEEYEGADMPPMEFNMCGRGGTDLRVLDTFVQENDIFPSVAIWLTDGETPWPESVDYPLLVVSTCTPAPEAIAHTILIKESSHD